VPSSSVPSFTLNTKALQSFKPPGTTQHHKHKDTNLEQHKYANLKLIAVVKLRGILQKGMKIEDVRNTKVVAFILFQQCLWTSENDTNTWSVSVFINE